MSKKSSKVSLTIAAVCLFASYLLFIFPCPDKVAWVNRIYNLLNLILLTGVINGGLIIFFWCGEKLNLREMIFTQQFYLICLVNLIIWLYGSDGMNLPIHAYAFVTNIMAMILLIFLFNLMVFETINSAEEKIKASIQIFWLIGVLFFASLLNQEQNFLRACLFLLWLIGFPLFVYWLAKKNKCKILKISVQVSIKKEVNIDEINKTLLEQKTGDKVTIIKTHDGYKIV